MAKKRIIVFFLTAVMLLSLFAACSTDNEKEDDADNQTTAGETTAAESQAEETNTAETSDTTDEIETKTFVYLGDEIGSKAYTLQDAIDNGWGNWKQLTQGALDEYNLIIEHDLLDNDSYVTTLNGMIASHTLPDSFLVQALSTDTKLAAIEQGFWADIDDLLEYSDGTASGLFADDGACHYLKAQCMAEDGHWYYMTTGDGNGTSLNLDTADRDYINNWPMHTWYELNMRNDWLKKIGIDMPTTTEEVKEALVSMQANDCNGNDVADERAFLGIGNDDYLFANGVANWFGLPSGNFLMDTVTGEVQMPQLIKDQYLAYMEYMNDLYTAGVTQIGEGGSFNFSTDVAGNYCSAHVMYPENTMHVTIGDDNCDYEPVPVIQALDGVMPKVIGQSVTNGIASVGFNVDCDYDAGGRFIDYVNGKTYYMLMVYGVEGKAYDYNDDGTLFSYSLSTEDALTYGNMWHFMPWNGLPECQLGFVYDPAQVTYDGIQEALDNGEPYRVEFLKTHDEWYDNMIASYPQKTWLNISCLDRWLQYMADYGEDNIYYGLNTSFTSILTDDEFAVQSEYLNDCETYLNEMSTNFITGATSMDEYDEMLDYLYNTLHLQELINSYQTSVNRFWTAMGREAVPIG